MNNPNFRNNDDMKKQNRIVYTVLSLSLAVLAILISISVISQRNKAEPSTEKKARDNGEERRNHCRSGVKRHSRCRCRGRRGGGCSPRFHRAGTGSGDKGLFDLGSGLLSDNGRLPCSLGC